MGTGIHLIPHPMKRSPPEIRTDIRRPAKYHTIQGLYSTVFLKYGYMDTGMHCTFNNHVSVRHHGVNKGNQLPDFRLIVY